MPEFVEWMMGFPHGWTATVSRTQRLRMLGNAVQVQVGEVAARVAVATLCGRLRAANSHSEPA